MKYRNVFFKQHILDSLNKLGYVNFNTKEQAKTYIDGRAFYFCPELKEYGYTVVVPYNEDIKGNIKFLENAVIDLQLQEEKEN